MDSGNSGSMQSSSGGDEEYDSRAVDSNITPFFNSSGYFGSITTQPTTLFDLSSHNSSNLAAFSQPAPPPTGAVANQGSNLDLAWSSGLRSDQQPFSIPPVASANQVLFGVQGLISRGPFSRPPADGTAPPPPCDQPNPSVKNPKKRTRASRRAPTTVLTTDTTNFRQMVQEFTGIPASPFSGAGSPYSRRLDLFGSCSTAAVRPSAANLDSHGPLYPLRPSAQKVQLSPSSASPSWLNSNMIASSGSNNINYQHTSEYGLQKHPETILGMQNSIPTFQSLLSSPNLSQTLRNNPPLANPTPFFNSKSQETSSTIPSLDELGNLNQEPLNPNLMSRLPSQKISSNSDGRTANEQAQNGSSHQNVGVYKLNCSSSVPAASDLNATSSRGEGTVESWLCPSDH